MWYYRIGTAKVHLYLVKTHLIEIITCINKDYKAKILLKIKKVSFRILIFGKN